MNINFRFATAEDTALILKFIRKFDQFQHNMDTVTATEESLKKWVFEEGKAEALFALDGDKEIGFVLCNHSFSAHQGKPALFLECFFIEEEYRGQGIGAALIRKVAQTCIERGWVRVECNSPDWNAASVKFYNHLGFEEMNGWTVYRIDGEALDALANGKKLDYNEEI